MWPLPSQSLGPAAPPGPGLKASRRHRTEGSRPRKRRGSYSWGRSRPDTPPAPAETRIDEKPDFYPLETGNVLTHGRRREAASCPRSSGSPPAASAPNTFVNEPKQIASAAGCPPEGARRNPEPRQKTESGSGSTGEGGCHSQVQRYPLKPAAAKARRCLPARTKRALGGKEAGDGIYQARWLETSTISLHGRC